MEQFTEHQIQAWIGTPHSRQSIPANDDTAPPTQLEVFIAELRSAGVSENVIEQAARASNPYISWRKRHPAYHLNFAARIAKVFFRLCD